MKLLKRLFLLLSVFVCCFVLGLNSLTVSAASADFLFNPNSYDLESVKISNTGDVWLDPLSYVWGFDESYFGQLAITFPSDASFSMWRAKFTPLDASPDLVIQPYMQINCTLFFQYKAVNDYLYQEIVGAMYLTAPDGTIYEFPVKSYSANEANNRIYCSLGGTADVVDGFRFSDCDIEFVIKGITNFRGVTVAFNAFNVTAKEHITDNTVKIVESIEKGFADLQSKQDQNTQDIIDNQNQNTQDIIDNDNANAGKTHGFLQNIKDGIGNLVDQIVALPGKIWEVIENGLKALFIPDGEYIASYKSKWDELLSSRFGAVYESSEILIELAQGITEADQTDTVSIPRVAIPMPDNNEFVFGPYDVKVVPDASALKFLVDACKMITSIVAVFLFINALRKRWEEVMNAD